MGGVHGVREGEEVWREGGGGVEGEEVWREGGGGVVC